MDKLTWSPAFETGVADIDSDHRTMFALANEIGEGIAKQDKTFRAKLQRFIALTEAHFAREEELLVRSGYPDAEAHKAYHASLMAKAQELKAICDAKGDSEQAGGCYLALVDFLIDDVVRGDTQFKSHLDDRGLTRG
jgi:hemerythrin